MLTPQITKPEEGKKGLQERIILLATSGNPALVAELGAIKNYKTNNFRESCPGTYKLLIFDSISLNEALMLNPLYANSINTPFYKLREKDRHKNN